MQSGPSSVNASVNSQAVFHCLASKVDLVVWYFNDSSIDTIPNLIEDQALPEQVNESVTRFTLTLDIDGSVDVNLLNNSLVTCAGLWTSDEGGVYFTDTSPPALLLIQGYILSQICGYYVYKCFTTTCF